MVRLRCNLFIRIPLKNNSHSTLIILLLQVLSLQSPEKCSNISQHAISLFLSLSRIPKFCSDILLAQIVEKNRTCIGSPCCFYRGIFVFNPIQSRIPPSSSVFIMFLFPRAARLVLKSTCLLENVFRMFTKH